MDLAMREAGGYIGRGKDRGEKGYLNRSQRLEKSRFRKVKESK
jgi:hypothetical protein